MRKTLGRSALVVVALIAASCGSDDDDASSDTTGDDATEETTAESTAAPETTDMGDDTAEGSVPEDDMAEVEVATIVSAYQPAGLTSCMRLTDDLGIFADHGIEMQWEQASPNMSVDAARVQQGELNIGITGTTNIVQAIGSGVPITMVSAIAEDYNIDGRTGLAVVAGPNTGIETWADLEGKTVAVSSLAPAFETTLAETMEIEGADYDQVTLVAITFPDQIQAVLDGRADAIYSIQPFTSGLIAQGGVFLGNPEEIAFDADNVTSTAMYMSQEYVEENEDVVTRFTEAYAEGSAYCNENPDEVRATTDEYTEVPTEVINATPVEPFSAALSAEEIDRWIELLVKHEIGEVPDGFSAEEVIWSGAQQK